LFTLGSDFESIQHNYRIGSLPVAWQTDDWPSLLILCRDYYNSLHPNGPPKKDHVPHENVFASKQERVVKHKKIRSWFMDPIRFKRELDIEQRKHVGKRIYHLCDNHPTATCNVKRECDALLAERKSSLSTGSNQGQLRHITVECYEDAVEDDHRDVDCHNETNDTNDTNDASLHYFSRVTNHYLHLVKSKSQPNPRHGMKYPIIADSGANYHMFKEAAFFDHIEPATGNVILGDGKTSLKNQGIGTIKLKFGDHILSVPNVRFIPDLSESIYSLFLHIRSPGHALHSSFSDGLSIVFPEFQTKAVIGHDDIYLDAVPISELTSANSTISTLSGSNSSDCCRHITQFQNEVKVEAAKADNLLIKLREYHKDVKTCRQLNMEVPTGFC
jgi:hypothetical protein